MKTGINLYLASEFEYRRGLAHKLLNENVIDFCLADYLPWTVGPEHDDRIVTVNHSPSYDAEYSDVCDINEFPAVSKEIMEAMLPYESMAIHLGMRRFDYPSTEYDEEKRRYLQHLRYWNYMLDKYQINLIVTHCIPHSQGKYVVYGLAQIKRIPFLMWHRIGLFNERVFWGLKLEEIGKSIQERFIKLTQERLNDFELEPDIEEVFQTCACEPIISVKQKYDNRLYKSNKKHLNEKYVSKRKEYIKKMIKAAAHSIIYHGEVSIHDRNDEWFRMTRRHLFAVRYYRKHLCYGIKHYNCLAGLPDYSKKYIVFLLHVTPEAVVMPLAGVFSSQYNAIQLLARGAEKMGCYVYVKEHPHNVYRSKDFYTEISSIPNVRLIKSSVTSYDLMKNSIAVATLTGSCLIEALRLKKPMMVFSGGYLLKGCPGLYEIVDENQCASVIETIEQGFQMDYNDVRRYFYSLQLESLKEVHFSEDEKRVFDDNYIVPPFPLEDRVKLIKDTINAYDIGIH